ncbi:MAG: hypothetical protein H6740_25510 [Alphaproteobacteria bacterium]|nr:hypothetical protein [Alphaproteobacteria bacterium]
MKRRLVRSLLNAALGAGDPEDAPSGLRARAWLRLSRLLSVAHPTNASGNNMSQR